MNKSILVILFFVIISCGLFAQKELITLNFTGVNSNNQTVTLESVLIENLTQGLEETIFHPDLSITLEYEAGIGESSVDAFKGSLVYPNPFSDYSIILINNPKSQRVEIAVFDNTGRLIDKQVNKLQEGMHNYKFYAANAGTYSIILSNEKQKTVLKAVSIKSDKNAHQKLMYMGQGVLNKSENKSSAAINTIPYQQGDVLRFTGFANGYPLVSITDSPTNSKSYEFEFSQYFRLSEQLVETETPSFVNIMFQVTDQNHIGIDNLTTESFIVKEDNQTVSPTETFMYINKMSSIPYLMKTVLLLDNSASVAPNLEEIKNAAINLVSNMVEKQEVAIMVFSDATTLLTDFTDNEDDLVAAIESIELGFPSTDLYGSIIDAVSMWNDSYSIDLIQQGFLIALTDGDDTQGSHTLTQAVNAIGDKRVYMIGLGNEINPGALEQLANPGPFYNPNQANELIEIFSEIQNDIVKFANSFYWMNYMSPKREDNHSLKLEVTDNNNSGDDSYISSNFFAGNFYSVYSGVYINSDDSSPYGIDTIYIPNNTMIDLKAITYWANESPVYDWISSNPDKVEIIFDEFANSKVRIFAQGDSSNSAIVTVSDISNNYSKSLYVEIGSYYEGTFTDPRDNQTYNTVIINDQEWFSENLNFETSNSWCYDNNSNNCEEYGRLYKWEPGMSACPDGWHLPSDDEWKALEMLLGMTEDQANQTGWRGNDEGEKLKSTNGWFSNGNGVDAMGFTALPGGYGSNFAGLEYIGYWWSSTEFNSSKAWNRNLAYDHDQINRDDSGKASGFSIRCIKD